MCALMTRPMVWVFRVIAGAKGRVFFFLEKKKQKDFDLLRHYGRSVQDNSKHIKIFWFFFIKKNNRSTHMSARKPLAAPRRFMRRFYVDNDLDRPMRHTFFCVDGHTAGNPLRLVAGGAPLLRGASMAERRQDFMARFDWIRTGLCFEPRGHAMMSGGFLYPPTQEDADAGILFIETSGCLPMCGHGTIGLVTFGLEHGLLQPREKGRLRLEVPAGMIDVTYVEEQGRVQSVTIRNVPAYVAATGIMIDVPDFGPLRVDVAYGGNFYAIIEPQGAFESLDALGAQRILELSPVVRNLMRAAIQPVHPLDSRIAGVSHVLWVDKGGTATQGRNAVFYGDHAIDRSPCGTGTSARLAHLWHKGVLKPGDRFIHDSYIHSRFIGTVAEEVDLAGQKAIIPLIQGSAISTGFNTIWIDPEDVFHEGFVVS